MAADFYRTRLPRRGLLARLLCRDARLKRLNPAANSRQRAPKVCLQLLQLVERVGLGLADDLVVPRLRVLHDLRAVPFGTTKDLVLRGGLLCTFVGARHDAGGFGMRF